ncbi:MAG TPA: class I SAM-dependent methyltransferase [Polyangiales bacterium]|jgi:SAM-dependent methyltransferase|nr:class I SAM-dependent methyltransferase [Polyangiales bacterium]
MQAAPSRLAELISPLIPHRFIAAQLRQPTGPFGRWVMTRILNRGNAELITAAIDALALQRADSFLDLGFGGGLGLRLALARTDAPLWGVDFSADVVRAGMSTFRQPIAAGRLNLLCADVADLPLRDGLVNAICSTNTIYFWPDPLRGLRSLRRVLSDGGRLALGFTGEEKMRGYGELTTHGFTFYNAERVEALLREAGFSQVQTLPQHGRFSRGDYVCLATR